MSQKVETSINQMIECLQGALDDAEKFDRGNDSAGMRLRKALQQVAGDCKITRAGVQAVRNARKAAKAG